MTSAYLNLTIMIRLLLVVYMRIIKNINVYTKNKYIFK